MRKEGGPSSEAVDSGSYKQCLAWFGAWKHVRQYLNVLDDAVVAKFPPCAVSSRGKSIGRNVQEGAIAVVRDAERGHRDCVVLAAHSRGIAGQIVAYSESGRAETGRLHRLLCY